jgi:hypothetical protein
MSGIAEFSKAIFAPFATKTVCRARGRGPEGEVATRGDFGVLKLLSHSFSGMPSSFSTTLEGGRVLELGVGRL